MDLFRGIRHQAQHDLVIYQHNLNPKLLLQLVRFIIFPKENREASGAIGGGTGGSDTGVAHS